MFKIYGMHTPMFLKAVLVAEELGVKYEIVPVDLTKGETKTAEHKRRHPFGKVPVLEHDGEFIFESNAIIRYMADVVGSPLYPRAPLPRAKVDEWLDYFSHQAGRWCTSIWFQTYVAPKFFNEPTDEKVVREATETLLADMPVIEQQLAKNPWFAGQDVTIADANAFMLMRGYKQAGLNFGDFPAFIRWHDRYAARPAVVRMNDKGV